MGGFSPVLIAFIIFETCGTSKSNPPLEKANENHGKNKCAPGYYGYKCRQKCHSSCSECDFTTGLCTQCSKVGFRLPECTTPCDKTKFGQDCRHQCDEECLNGECESKTGFCYECQDKGLMLPTCTTSCLSGTYGMHCKERCPSPCRDNCDSRTGHCLSCTVGQGPHCTVNCAEIENEEACRLYCPSRCLGWCNTTDRKCSMCTSGYKKPFCKDYCDQGTFGSQCKRNCSRRCRDSQCDPIRGDCVACVDGYVGKHCNGKCVAGLWGADCLQRCPETCSNRQCKAETGECESCPAGYSGPSCDRLCEMWTYGENCASPCPSKCRWPCDPVTGECQECLSGYQGPTCNISCDPGTFGLSCNKTCPIGCLNQLCQPITGKCIDCKENWSGPKCDKIVSTTAKPIELILYTVTSLLAPIFVFGLILICYKRCSKAEVRTIVGGQKKKYNDQKRSRKKARQNISKTDIHLVTETLEIRSHTDPYNLGNEHDQHFSSTDKIKQIVNESPVATTNIQDNVTSRSAREQSINTSVFSPNTTQIKLRASNVPCVSSSFEIKHSVTEKSPSSIQIRESDIRNFSTPKGEILSIRQHNLTSLQDLNRTAGLSATKNAVSDSILPCSFNVFQTSGRESVNHTSKPGDSSTKEHCLPDESIHSSTSNIGFTFDSNSDLESGVARFTNVPRQKEVIKNTENQSAKLISKNSGQLTPQSLNSSQFSFEKVNIRVHKKPSTSIPKVFKNVSNVSQKHKSNDSVNEVTQQPSSKPNIDSCNAGISEASETQNKQQSQNNPLTASQPGTQLKSKSETPSDEPFSKQTKSYSHDKLNGCGTQPLNKIHTNSSPEMIYSGSETLKNSMCPEDHGSHAKPNNTHITDISPVTNSAMYSKQFSLFRKTFSPPKVDSPQHQNRPSRFHLKDKPSFTNEVHTELPEAIKPTIFAPGPILTEQSKASSTKLSNQELHKISVSEKLKNNMERKNGVGQFPMDVSSRENSGLNMPSHSGSDSSNDDTYVMTRRSGSRYKRADSLTLSSQQRQQSKSPGLVRCSTTRNQVDIEAKSDHKLAPLPTPPTQGRAILRPVRKLSRSSSASNTDSHSTSDG